MTRRRRHRIAWIALLGLLFQQLAMAAYACPMETGAALAAASATHRCHPAGAPDAARCAEHCHPIVPSNDHPPAPGVPASILPPSVAPIAPAAIVALTAASAPEALASRGGAPPLGVLFCSLQF